MIGSTLHQKKVEGMIMASFFALIVIFLTALFWPISEVPASGPIKAEAYYVDNLEWPREVCILTLLAEARSGGPSEMYLIACVIYNRMTAGGYQGWEVVTAPQQFSWLNDMESDNYINTMRILPESLEYRQASRIWDWVTSGQAKDRTAGATHYYAAGSGRPAWADKSFKRINNSLHYYGVPQ